MANNNFSNKNKNRNKNDDFNNNILEKENRENEENN